MDKKEVLGILFLIALIVGMLVWSVFDPLNPSSSTISTQEKLSFLLFAVGYLCIGSPIFVGLLYLLLIVTGTREQREGAEEALRMGETGMGTRMFAPEGHKQLTQMKKDGIWKK